MSGVGRGLARLRDFRWDMYAQPLREVRLEVEIVYVAIHVPFGGGKAINLPVLTMIKPAPVPAEQAQTRTVRDDG